MKRSAYKAASKMSNSSDDDGDFGQEVPPLHIYLKRVLDKYPEGGQILKELLQNADDAGARRVVFLYDNSTHPAGRLWSQSLGECQGPALYAYNDAVFQEADWKNIQYPEQSGKLEDASKIGRFGLGFISVYHLTDMPWILSGDKIGFLDPLERHFDDRPRRARNGKRWRLSDRLLSDYPDQFAPFLSKLFGCDRATFGGGTFPGTLFRFPLRRAASKISKSVFIDEARVDELLESFQRDAELSLLFLKHVESISVYKSRGRSKPPTLVDKVGVQLVGIRRLRCDRESLLEGLRKNRDCLTACCVGIERKGRGQPSSTRYMVVNQVKVSGLSPSLRDLTADDELGLRAWMGVALRVGSGHETRADGSGGRLFCFLPLPESAATGLPVHVHGYFGLGDNRRSLKWPDSESQHDKKALWNQMLSTEVFPEVYTQAIVRAIEKCEDPQDPMSPADVYAAWPPARLTGHWSEGVEKFLQKIKGEKIVFSEASGGDWKTLSEVFIEKGGPTVCKLLRRKGCAVEKLPGHVLETLAGAYTEVTPALVRGKIRRDTLSYLTRRKRLVLLDYVTSDTAYNLKNLHLLPLQNGEFTGFLAAAPAVYVETAENPSCLIPNGGARFAAADLSAGLLRKLLNSGKQLQHFRSTSVLPLMKEMLPSSWRKGTDSVLTWTPGVNDHPSREWLTRIWEWLCRNYPGQDLSCLEGIPLIPMERNRLARLKQMMIRDKEDGQFHGVGLAESVCSLLSSLGAVVVRQSVLAEHRHITRHPQLRSFIKKPTAEGVMAVLEMCSNTADVHRQVASLSDFGKDELRGLLVRLSHYSSQSVQILKNLPLFRAGDGQYMSARACTSAVPSDYFGIPAGSLRRPLIILNPAEWSFLKNLGIHKMSVSELLQKNILPAVQDGFYDNGTAARIMLWVLQHREHDAVLRELRFVPTRSSKAKPGDLFEPTTTLRTLLGDFDVFPTGEFAEGWVLDCLRRVGLKGEQSVAAADIVRCAKAVSDTGAQGRADVVERGRAIVNHLGTYPHLLHHTVTRERITKPLRKFLENLPWIPCEAGAPRGYPGHVEWAGSRDRLYTPREVGLIESALLQGSVTPLCDLAGMEKLCEAFKWSKDMDHTDNAKVKAVVRHLKNVVHGHSEAADPRSSLRAVYAFLNEADGTHLRCLFEEIFGPTGPWVWHGFGFTTPSKIAFSGGDFGVNLAPYLHTLPKEFNRCADFLRTMGVRETFGEEALVDVLRAIKEKRKRDGDLRLVRDILQHLVTRGSVTSDILVPCRVPTGTGGRFRMHLASECLYADDARLASQLDGGDKPLLHEWIPNPVAQALGVKPLSHYIAPVEPLEYGGYDLAGPHEMVANAIRRNLDMYKKGVDIFKEMIQNADDAGATEVRFLVDWRRNDDTAAELLDEQMKACHGPALWAFNNGQFTERDIENICSIAAQSKKRELDKVGRFGLGFTSVYHLTDIPSIVSGPYILICDPLTTHLGSRVKSGQPGIRLDLRKEPHRRTLRSYPKQFAPYIGIFGCDPLASDNFDHTLIRLPLRTHAEASENPLCDRACDSKKEIDPLVKSLKKSAHTLLLFTQNVVEVSVFELSSEDVKDMKRTMHVNISRVRQMPRAIGDPQSDALTQRNLLAATEECLRKPHGETPETTMIAKVTQETCASGKRAGSKPKVRNSQFLISSCMARGDDPDRAESLIEEGRSAGVLPCGGVAVQLVSDPVLKPERCKDSGVFSYLPLGVSTGLPFHVNGGFLLQPNRRQLWSQVSSGTGEFETRWNIFLMQSVLLRAFTNLLEDLKVLLSEGELCNHDFQLLWPTQDPRSSDFIPFIDAFYRWIGSGEGAPAVVFSGNRWVAVDECLFLDCSPDIPDALRPSIETILNERLQPRRCVELTPEVTSSILKAGANQRFDANSFNFRRFLEEEFFPAFDRGGDLDPAHRDAIVLYLLDCRLSGRRQTADQLFDSGLKEACCIPTSPDGEDLAKPGELVNPASLVGSLYREEDCLFPYGDEFRSDSRLLSLNTLGMITTTLSWEDVCERAESIANGHEFDGRCSALLKLIESKLTGEDRPDELQVIRIRAAAFLPVLKKPRKYPVEWCNSRAEVMSANELHDDCHRELLGSVKCILDGTKSGLNALNPRVTKFLGIAGKKVDLGDVLEQLIVLKESDRVTQEVQSMALQIYRFLQGKIPADGRLPEAFVRLSGMKFILYNDRFLEGRQLAFHHSGKTEPYLYKVPRHFLGEFHPLLQSCGVRDDFELGDFVQALGLLKRKCGDRRLAEADLKTANALLAEIVSWIARTKSSNKCCLQNEEIFVPDIQGVLRKQTDVIYDDMHWVGCQDNELYTHPDVPRKTAQILGIWMRREKHYSSLSEFEMDFGQREELADRLKNILTSYPNVSDVFKELLQNADDAGSTEIHFVYDPRSHPTKKILSQKLASLQCRPSLCVYQDKAFTEKDIEGIQKLGVGGKRDDTTTTGKFGIGFNAVYHLTDNPSFLTNGSKLCVFDPLLKLKLVDTAGRSSSGKAFETNAKFREYFPDMLAGYLEDVGELGVQTGAVFRFPLRTEPSDLSDKVFSRSRGTELLGEFQRVSQEALLFLNNIKRITLSRMDGKELKTEYSIAADLSSEAEQHRHELTDRLKLLTDEPGHELEPMIRVYNFETRDSAGVEQSWLVSQTIGFDDPPGSGVQSAGAAFPKNPVPRGGVAALTGRREERAPQKLQGKAYCLLPLPVQTGLPVHVNGTFELDSARKNLAKPDDYASSLGGGRDQLISDWNRLLAEQVIAPAYAHLLKQAGRKLLGRSSAKHIHLQLSKYNNLFPTSVKSLQGEWGLVARAALRYISKERLEVLPVIRTGDRDSPITWHHPNSETSSAFFEGFGSLKYPEQIRQDRLRSTLLKVGFKLLSSPRNLCREFNESGVDQAKFVSPQIVVKHLSESDIVRRMLPSPLKKTAFTDIRSFLDVFEYCLDGITCVSEMYDLPLKLTNDGELGVFSSTDILYVTQYHTNILPREQHRFLHTKLVRCIKVWGENDKGKSASFPRGIFKRFTLDELAKYLAHQLPEDWSCCPGHVEWRPGRDGHPTEQWLADVWSFIYSETCREVPTSSLDAIDNWPMFPTKSGKLVPPRLSKTVLYLDHSVMVGNLQNVCNVLRKLGLPQISPQSMLKKKPIPRSDETSLMSILRGHLAQLRDPRDIAAVIRFTLENGGVGAVSPEEGNILLLYFQEGEDDEATIKVIKRLKIFKLLGGEETTDLQHSDHYHTVDCKILMDECTKWMGAARCAFLEPQSYLNLLFDRLNVKPISHDEIYLKYILPHFLLLSPETQMKHIEHLQRYIGLLVAAPGSSEEQIIHRLSRTEFILDESNISHAPGFFFDGDNEIFRLVVDRKKLLPQRYHALKEFLEEMGLRTTVEKEDFLNFAREVAKRAKAITDREKREQLVQLAYLLTKELSEERLHDAQFLEEVSKIEFLPPLEIGQELLDIHPGPSGPQHAGTAPFVAYRDGVPEKDLKLVWSVSQVLPRKAIPYDVRITKGITVHGCLGIAEGNVAEKVYSHIDNVCFAMMKKNVIHKQASEAEIKVRQKLRMVLEAILQYIVKQITTKHAEVGERVKSRLRNTPICLVEEGRILVRADQLVFEMEKDLESKLRPYLYKVPREWASFDSVFRLLGAQDCCSFGQLKGVLASMREEWKDEVLGPNERKIAVTALTGIVKLLKDESYIIADAEGELYLPSSEYILRNAKQLHYADPDIMELHSLASTDKEFILPLKTCGVSFDSETALIERLPEGLRPKKFGEGMQKRPCESNEDCEAGASCEYADHIQRIVSSDEMSRGVQRLVQWQSKGKEMNQESRSRKRKLEDFSDFKCKKVLKVGLYDSNGEKVAEEKHPSEAYFEAGSGNFFIQHTAVEEISGLTRTQIGHGCNHLMGRILTSESVGILANAIECGDDLGKLNEILTKSKIPEYDTATPAIQEDQSAPGCQVPGDIHHLLNQDPFNHFFIGEHVAYEMCPDETYPEETEIIFAEVILGTDVNRRTVSLTQTCKINMGQQEPAVVKVGVLYKFLRPQEEPTLDVVPSTAQSTGESPETGFAETLPEDEQADEEQIRAEVTEAFSLTDGERRRLLKRLYRKWHPDKNIAHQARTNRAFQFLKAEIERQEKGEDRETPCSGRYESWDRQARQDYEEARHYRAKSRRRRTRPSFSRNRTSGVPPSFTRDTPDPHKARLWFRQAREHLSTAEQASQQSCPSGHPIAFWIHQAAEAALRAAQYSLEGKSNDGGGPLPSLAERVCRHRHVAPSRELCEIATRLDRLGCQFDKPRRPDQFLYNTSGQVYDDFQADVALRECRDLLKIVQEIIGITEY